MRVIVNYDAPAGLMPHLKGDDLVQSLFGSTDRPNSPITDIWWNWGEGNRALYPSKILEPILGTYCGTEDFAPLIEQDIIGECVAETKLRKLGCYASYRINGNDSDGGKIQTAQFKLDNPDLCLYGPRYRKGRSAPLLNFEFDKVRDYKMHIIEELMSRYDWDGIEIDFARACPVLPPGEAWQKRDCITAFMGALRGALDGTRVAVRVPETITGCHFDGLDIGAWMKDGLVDTMIVGCRSLEVDYNGWLEMVRRGDGKVDIYPCYDDVHSSDGYHNPPLAVTRGVFGNWKAQGFEGLQTFNFMNADPHMDLNPDWEEAESVQNQWELHCQVYDDIAAHLMGPTTYVIQRTGGGRMPSIVSFPWDWDEPQRQYCNTNIEAQLPTTAPAMVHMYVAEPGDGVLGIRTSSRSKKLQARINNIELTGSAVGDWWEYIVPCKSLAIGDNLIQIGGRGIIEKVELTC